MSDAAVFTVGPPQPVTDSRYLPAVTAEDEAGFVHGADLGDEHPDNEPTDAEVDAVLGEIEAHGDDLPAEDDLDTLVAGVDIDRIDAVGFDDSDLVEPLGPIIDHGDQPVAGGS